MRKAQEGGRESEELAARFSWLRGDPWRDSVADVMRVLRSNVAWQRLLGFSTTAMRCLGLFFLLLEHSEG